MNRLDGILGGMTRVQHVLDANPERRLAALGFDYHEPVRPVELNGDQGPHVAGQMRFCKHCPASVICPLTEDEDGVFVSRCGIVHTSFASEDVSARNFADDDQKTRDKRLQSTVMYDEQRRELVEISRSEAGEAARNDKLWKAGNRLNQSTVWLKFVRDEKPGSFWLTESEVTKARLALKAVCTRWVKEGGDEAQFGSPVFWSIAMILEMVAQRAGGFTMPTPELCELCTMEGLHRIFRSKKGQAMVTDESEFSATKARGQAADAQREVNQVKWRHARFDELGGSRQSKLAVLSQLIQRAGIWPNPEATEETPDQARYLGLSDAVRKMQKPALAAAHLRGRGCVPAIVEVQHIKIGTDVDAPVVRTTTRALPDEAEEDEVAVKPEPDAPLPLAPAGSAAAAVTRAEAVAAAAKVAEAEAALKALREQAAAAQASAAEAAEAEVADEDLPDGYGESEDAYAAEVAAAYAKAVAEQRAEAEAAEKAATRDAEAEALRATADAEGEDAPSLRAGRPKRTPVKGELKKATLHEVLHSTQWHDKDREKAEAFWKRWLEESTAWRAQQEEKLRRRKDAEALKQRARDLKAAAQAKKADEAAAKYDEAMASRTFTHEMNQGAEVERKAKRAKGELSVRSELTNKRAGTLGKITIIEAPHLVTTSEKKTARLNAILAEAKSTDHWLACENCNTWRKLPEGELRPKKGTFFDCSQLGLACEEEKPPPPKRQKGGAKRR